MVKRPGATGSTFIARVDTPLFRAYSLHAARLLKSTRRLQPRYGQDRSRPRSAARSSLDRDVLVHVHPIDYYVRRSLGGP